MLIKKEHIGLALTGETIKIVSATVSGKQVLLNRFDTLQLVSPIEETVSKTDKSITGGESDEPDDIFGITADPAKDTDTDEAEELNLDEIDLFEEEEEEATEMDLVDESEQPETNELLLYNYLVSAGKRNRKSNLGLNILSGNTNFQIVRGTDYSKIRKKDLNELILNRLESVYGFQPSPDRFSHTVREDGTLIIASIDREPSILSLVNRVNELSSDKLVIGDILPDEVALTGLYRINYEKDDLAITGLIQLGVHQSRIIFFKGHDVLQVSPIINEGTSHKNYLKTIFSKILFQLDSGEIPGIDRIILADNSDGEKTITFFKKNFPDIAVEEFELNPDKFSFAGEKAEEIRKYTTAIAIAVKAAGYQAETYPAISLIPEYVVERQKIFKLEWHGILLLIAIGLSPIVINHFYQQNANRIDSLQSENRRYEGLISDITPVVNATEALQARLGEQQEQISLLNELVHGNIRWTATLDHFSAASRFVGNSWLTAMREGADGISLEGYALFEDRIPVLSRRFSNSMLRNVRREQIRDREIFYFSMLVRDVFSDDSLFTPENMRGLEEILQFNPQ